MRIEWNRCSIVKQSIAFVLVASTVLCSGCGPSRNHRGVPEALVDSAYIPGMEGVRTWGDATSDDYKQDFVTSARQLQAYYESHPNETIPATIDILAISGGGENGAFGAGLLCGWTKHGDRPNFKLVTGISTGALIAPLAFIGPEADEILKWSYTEVTKDDIFIPKWLLSLLTQDSLSNTEPLARLIDKTINEETLARIAEEHAKGRRLLIATTNLEAQRPVIWDMGMIASSNHPDAPKLFKNIMRASASIPGAFPPVYIDVKATDGKSYQEMHVDGGTVSQVFLWGAGLTIQDIVDELGTDARVRPLRLFVLRNGRFEPEHAELRSLFIDIAGRAVSTMVKTQGIGDMYRLYYSAQLNNLDFNLAWIPPEFDLKAKEPFEKDFMVALFNYGYERAAAGYPWSKRPPYSAGE